MWRSTKHFFYCICIQILNDGKIRESNQYQNDVISPALTTTISTKHTVNYNETSFCFDIKFCRSRCQETATASGRARARLKTPLILLKKQALTRIASPHHASNRVCYDIIIIGDWLFLFWNKVNAIYFG